MPLTEGRRSFIL